MRKVGLLGADLDETLIDLRPGEPLELSDCHNITVHDLTINGAWLLLENCQGVRIQSVTVNNGPDNFSLLECMDCTIIDCHAANPIGPPDPHGHNYLLDKCHDIRIVRCMSLNDMKVGGKVEDHINIFDSSNCRIESCYIRGPGPTDSGSGICLDGKNGMGHHVVGNRLLRTGQGGIIVAGGHKHWITDNRIDRTTNAGIGVQGFYGTVANVIIAENVIKPAKGSPIWIDPETTKNIRVLEVAP